MNAISWQNQRCLNVILNLHQSSTIFSSCFVLAFGLCFVYVFIRCT